MQNQSTGALQLLEQLGIKSNATKIQAHGLTVAQIEELRLEQSSGESPEMIDANCDASYKINEHESTLVHVLLEKEEWLKGKKLSKGIVKKFHENDFRSMSQTVQKKGEKAMPRNAFSEYDVVKVIHDPSAGRKLSAIVNPDTNDLDVAVEDMTIDQLRAKYFDLSGEVNETDDRETMVKLVNEAIEASK